MSLPLSDVLRILRMVKLYMKEGPASRKYVKDTFNDSPVKQAKIPHYGEIEALCSKLGLLSVELDKISLTRLGEMILKYTDRDESEEKFRETFIRDVVFGSKIGEKMYSDLSKFYIGQGDILWYPKEEVYDLLAFPAIIPILYEIGLLEKKNDTVEINPKYMHLMDDQKKITQKRLEEQLAEQRTVGKIGEEIALDFERNRLKRDGYLTEASKVNQISMEFANAGYDIESFAKSNDGRMHRIYIEVKGSRGTDVDFYWSANEVKKSKMHGENYWIYFVPGIDMRTKRSSGDPIRIRNPYKIVFSDPSFKTKIEQYHVTQNRTG